MVPLDLFKPNSQSSFNVTFDYSNNYDKIDAIGTNIVDIGIQEAILNYNGSEGFFKYITIGKLCMFWANFTGGKFTDTAYLTLPVAAAQSELNVFPANCLFEQTLNGINLFYGACISLAQDPNDEYRFVFPYTLHQNDWSTLIETRSMNTDGAEYTIQGSYETV